METDRPIFRAHSPFDSLIGEIRAGVKAKFDSLRGQAERAEHLLLRLELAVADLARAAERLATAAERLAGPPAEVAEATPAPWYKRMIGLGRYGFRRSPSPKAAGRRAVSTSAPSG